MHEKFCTSNWKLFFGTAVNFSPILRKLLWILPIMFEKPRITKVTVTDLANFCVTPLFRCPQGSHGCLEKQNHPLSLNLVVWCAKIGPKTKKVRKTSELTKKCQKWWFFDTFLKFLGFGPNFRAPNYQIQTQWMILLLYTPLGILGTSK